MNLRTHLASACLCIAACSATTDTAELSGQGRSTEAEALRELRLSGNPHKAITVLGQERRSYPTAALDALADSLTVIAASYSEQSGESSRTATAAVTAISFAGGPNVRATYAGSFQRLQQIAESARSYPIRSVALKALAKHPQRQRAIAVLVSVAVSNEPTAVDAVSFLAQEAGAEGQEALRVAYLAGKIVEPIAAQAAFTIAQHFRW